MQETTRLLEIMKKLRDPKTGCPWDVEQDFTSIAPYTLEEAYEVADAIERNDMANLQEELGDLLLQVVFHSQMANEQGLFNFEEVAAGVNEKMIRRHPHVFGNGAKVKTAQDQLANWDAIKATEKTQKKGESVLDDVPNKFPALLRAQKMGKAASKKGFDWPEISPVFEKVEEEFAELQEAVAENSNIEEELGDLLFAVVNIARHVKVDAETALRKANQKFESRFRYVEQQITDESSLAQMEEWWDSAKKREGSNGS